MNLNSFFFNVIIIGLDHLLYTKKSGKKNETMSGKDNTDQEGEKEEGEEEEEEEEELTELRIACFMGLVSLLSGRPEVLRVAARHKVRLYNAAARSMIQSATVTSEPLTLAGLDGSGEVIQVCM